MRVSEGGTRPREAPAVARSKAFGDAMRRAREGSAAAARGAAAREHGFRTASARRTVADGKDDALAGRRQGSREEERLSAGAAPPQIAGQATAVRATGDVAGPAELRAVIRALPVAIHASRVREGAPLTLTLGRALDVDVRAGRAGVELVLRPDPRLARATEAELPGLVASLRSRGIAVARAEVRARGGDGGRRRVDVSTPLR